MYGREIAPALAFHACRCSVADLIDLAATCIHYCERHAAAKRQACLDEKRGERETEASSVYAKNDDNRHGIKSA